MSDELPYSGKFQGFQFSWNGNLAVPELLRPQYLVGCASYRIRALAQTHVLPGSYATFLQNELLNIKAHRCSHSILSSVFSYLKLGENFS